MEGSIVIPPRLEIYFEILPAEDRRDHALISLHYPTIMTSQQVISAWQQFFSQYCNLP